MDNLNLEGIGPLEITEQGTDTDNTPTDQTAAAETDPNTADADPTTNDPTIDGNDGTQTEQPKYTVKVNGEEVEVTLEELQSGFMMHKDYTSKTQEIAAVRKQIADFEQLTGWKMDEALQFYQNQATPPGDGQGDAGNEATDPKVQQLEQQLNTVMEFVKGQQAEQQLTQQIADLQGKYGDKFSAEQVIDFALKHNEPDLDKAFKLMRADQLDEATLREQIRQDLLKEMGATHTRQQNASVTMPTNGVGVQNLEQGPPKTIREASQRTLQDIKDNNIQLTLD